MSAPNLSAASTGNVGPAIPTVLLVENDGIVALLTIDELERAGCVTEYRPNGPSALELIERLSQLDAAVVNLDLGLGCDGRHLVRTLRSRWPDLPVIVMTGYAADAPQADLRGLDGPTVRVHKPADIDGLRLLFASLVAGGRQRRDPSRYSRRTDRG